MLASERLESSKVQEHESLAQALLDHIFGLQRYQVILNDAMKIAQPHLDKFYELLGRLECHEPFQYVVGECEFFGLRFIVNQDVLIPRPETEELVSWILKYVNLKHPHILDIGTGTGCIPISLCKNAPGKYYAYDISVGALAVAKKNAELNEASVSFEEVDILHQPIGLQDLDVVVSNPPYISMDEKALMSRNVLDFEPHLALFPVSTDFLIFYRTIATKAFKALKKGGKLFFEMNEYASDAIQQIMQDAGFLNIVQHQDLQGKNRMIVGQR